MAVTNVCLHKVNAGGEINTEGSSLEAIYRVEVDDVRDGPLTVLAAVGLPALRSSWDYGEGAVTESGNVFLQRMRADRTSNDLIWYVTCVYETQTFGELVDENGLPVTDVADIPLRIVPTFERELAPVETAYFHGYFDRNGTAIADLNSTGAPESGSLVADQNNRQLVANSACVAFIPALERTVSRMVLKCTRWYTSFPSVAEAGLDMVNDAVQAIVGLDASGNYFNQTYQIDELLYRNVTCELMVQDDYEVLLRLTYELAVKRGGWYADILDRGRFRRGSGGSPDGFGGVFPSSLAAGVSSSTPIRDAAGGVIDEPVPFDGQGQPLSSPHDFGSGAVNWPDNQVYLRYRMADRFDMSQLFA